MLLPPITPDGSAAPGRSFAPSIRSPRARPGYATFRLFHGEQPPTLSVKDQVAVTVAERIVERRLKPGERISEQSVADDLNVSKAPVSEALMLLEYTGLVESSARRSAYVAPMNVVQFEELQEYRSALVDVIAPRFFERHGPADRKVIRDYVDHMKELVSDDARALEFVEVADRSILYMGTQSGNRHIARAMFPLSLQLLRYYGFAIRTLKQRRRMLDWWSQASPLLDARDAAAFMALTQQARATLVNEIQAALRAAT